MSVTEPYIVEPIGMKLSLIYRPWYVRIYSEHYVSYVVKTITAIFYFSGNDTLKNNVTRSTNQRLVC